MHSNACQNQLQTKVYIQHHFITSNSAIWLNKYYLCTWKTLLCKCVDECIILRCKRLVVNVCWGTIVSSPWDNCSEARMCYMGMSTCHFDFYDQNKRNTEVPAVLNLLTRKCVPSSSLDTYIFLYYISTSSRFGALVDLMPTAFQQKRKCILVAMCEKENIKIYRTNIIYTYTHLFFKPVHIIIYVNLLI